MGGEGSEGWEKGVLTGWAEQSSKQGTQQSRVESLPTRAGCDPAGPQTHPQLTTLTWLKTTRPGQPDPVRTRRGGLQPTLLCTQVSLLALSYFPTESSSPFSTHNQRLFTTLRSDALSPVPESSNSLPCKHNIIPILHSGVFSPIHLSRRCQYPLVSAELPHPGPLHILLPLPKKLFQQLSRMGCSL